MENDVYSDPEPYDALDIREAASVVWAGRKKVVMITTLFALLSVLYALSLPNQYKASVLLAPAQNEASALSSTMTQFGGLASLAGLGIGSGKSSEAQIAIQIMQSWSFIESFIKDADILLEVFASEGVHDDSGDLLINSELYDTVESQWLIPNSKGILGPPSSWQSYQVFSELLSVSQDRNTGLVTAEIEFFSAKIAQDWLDRYLAAINKYMQQRHVTKISNNIAYLEDQIARTSITEMQEVFYTIIEEQIKSKMLAEASPEYVFVIVSPSMVAEVKSQPQRAYISILGTLLGGMLSLLLVLGMHYGRKSGI